MRIYRNSLRYANQLLLRVGDVVWCLSSRNVINKPLNVTKSWTGPLVVDQRVVLYRIKPYDTGNPYPPITVNVGWLRKFNMARLMPPDLVTDPDEDCEELPIAQEPSRELCQKPAQPSCRIDQNQRLVEPPESWPPHDGVRRNRPARAPPWPAFAAPRGALAPLTQPG